MAEGLAIGTMIGVLIGMLISFQDFYRFSRDVHGGEGVVILTKNKMFKVVKIEAEDYII